MVKSIQIKKRESFPAQMVAPLRCPLPHLAPVPVMWRVTSCPQSLVFGDICCFSCCVIPLYLKHWAYSSLSKLPDKCVLLFGLAEVTSCVGVNRKCTTQLVTGADSKLPLSSLTLCQTSQTTCRRTCGCGTCSGFACRLCWSRLPPCAASSGIPIDPAWPSAPETPRSTCGHQPAACLWKYQQKVKSQNGPTLHWTLG